jgi:hypothetical protein
LLPCRAAAIAAACLLGLNTNQLKSMVTSYLTPLINSHYIHRLDRKHWLVAAAVLAKLPNSIYRYLQGASVRLPMHMTARSDKHQPNWKSKRRLCTASQSRQRSVSCCCCCCC